MGYTVKDKKPENSGYTSDFWECYRKAKKDGYNDYLAKAYCEYLFG